MYGLFSILRHLPKYLRLSWRLMRDPGVPWYLKLIVIGAILYGLLPIDLLPEAFFPPLGYGEDALFFLLAIRNLIWGSPKEIVTRHARQIALKTEESDRDVHRKG